MKPVRIALVSALVPMFAACATTPTAAVSEGDRGAEPPTSALYREIADRDAAVSDAFNRHDADALMALFDRDLEFFHDADGLQRYDRVQEDFRRLLAQDNGLRRELVPGSLRVYPVKDYGAMEIGKHRFCHMENGRNDCGTFNFLHVWRRTADGWKITRVMSYGH